MNRFFSLLVFFFCVVSLFAQDDKDFPSLKEVDIAGGK